MEAKKSARAATDREIRLILGYKTDDDLVMAIRNTCASQEEVLQAFEWIDDDDYMGKTTQKPPSGNVRRVYEMLLEDRDKENREEH